MISRRLALSGSAIGLGTAVMSSIWASMSRAAESFEVSYGDAEWRKRLTPDQYAVLRQSATEQPFTSPLLHEERHGLFACAGCGLDLFSSTTKFDSGTGWPASGRHSRKPSARSATPLTAWCAPQCIAGAAAVISAMSSPTARSPRAFAIA